MTMAPVWTCQHVGRPWIKAGTVLSERVLPTTRFGHVEKLLSGLDPRVQLEDIRHLHHLADHETLDSVCCLKGHDVASDATGRGLASWLR